MLTKDKSEGFTSRNQFGKIDYSCDWITEDGQRYDEFNRNHDNLKRTIKCSLSNGKANDGKLQNLNWSCKFDDVNKSDNLLCKIEGENDTVSFPGKFIPLMGIAFKDAPSKSSSNLKETLKNTY